MKKDMFGAVLKRRIKEMGYTQEEFADKVGIGYSTLKKYLSGKNLYDVELLLRFAEVLECSCDYLLGLSVSPRRENQDISNELRLSDEAIDEIRRYANAIDSDMTARRNLEVINAVVTKSMLIEAIGEYFVTSRKTQNIMLDSLSVLFDDETKKEIKQTSAVQAVDDTTKTIIPVIVALIGEMKAEYDSKIVKENQEFLFEKLKEIEQLAKQLKVGR